MTEFEIVTLKEFMQSQNAALAELFNARIDAVDKATNARIDAVEKATTIAKEYLEKRLDTLNEIRGALKDQNQTFVTKEMHEKIEDDIKDLRTFKDEQSGKASQASVYIAYGLAALGLIIELVLRFK